MNDQTSKSALLRIGTRGSQLALAQAHELKRRLSEANSDLSAPDAIEIVVITSTGDRVRDRPLSEIGGKGLFVKELEEALLAGGIDLGVHSMKDVETTLAAGTEITAVLPREDPRDALVSPVADRLEDLPEGAIFGTSSVRRAALVLHRRPDLRIVQFRGNVDTRLQKLADGVAHATMLALCGLKRLGIEDRATRVLDTGLMPPAVTQGCICVQCRSDDDRVTAWVRRVDHPESHARAVAERAMLAALDGSCRSSIAGLATIDGGTLSLDGYVASLDGVRLHHLADAGAVADAAEIGRALGERLKAMAGPDLAA